MRGEERDLLHQLDHLMRDMLVVTKYKARKLNLADEGIEAAFVTVLMSVAAGTALAVAANPTDVTDEIFASIARDALLAAKQRVWRQKQYSH
jgi:hypothetical protein